ncbi:MAG: peptidyl-prolyl cis-trans isomerase [Planctomycetes bacterium]|nr:peptidyl-prolyl cis-trans isomerase [Planctomycetota bacterium]
MKRWLREPLLHFLLIGAVLWAASSLGGERRAAAGDEIVVSAARIEQLTAVFIKTRQRLPTRAELDRLIEDWVREELAYREGKQMGLDRDDTIVRRRIRQKLEFFVEGLTDQIDPGEEQLAVYLRDHADLFRRDPLLDFRQVYLSPDEHRGTLEADAAELLETLRTTPDVDIYALGDRLMVDRVFRDTPLREVRAVFGDEFANRLVELEVGRWTGPIRSGYGMHLVVLGRKLPGRLPELAEVRDEVLREWQNAARERALRDFYDAMAERYEIRVEWPADEPTGDESP